MSSPIHQDPAASGLAARTSPLLAGGALLTRGIGRNRRVAIVERAGAWGLPRAVASDGQSLLLAAREAVRDQLGAAFLAKDFAGARRAELGGQAWLSFYWRGTVGRTLPGFEGLARIRWVLLEEALRVIDYAEEAELIEEALGDPGPPLTETGAQLRREAHQRARVFAASQAARSLELAMDAAPLGPEEQQALDARLASCLATARSASHVRGAGAAELAHALFTAAELHDCACMDKEQRRLRAGVVAAELQENSDPAQARLAAELHAQLDEGQASRLPEVLAASADASAQARLAQSAAPPAWLRYVWPLAVVAGAPFLLQGTTLDPEVPPNLLPWYGAVWAGVAGGCLLPARYTRRGRHVLDTSGAWLGGVGGLVVWLAVIAGLLEGIAGPPAALFGAAIVGALTTGWRRP